MRREKGSGVISGQMPVFVVVIRDRHQYWCHRIIGWADTDLDNDLDQQRMMDSPAAPGIWQLLRRKTGQVQVQEIGDCPESLTSHLLEIDAC